MVGIIKTQLLIKDVFAIAIAVIKQVKAAKELAAEFKDIDAVEAVSMIVEVVTNELPALIAELKKDQPV